MSKAARAANRTFAEYLKLYALEGFLLRLAHSAHRQQFVLKGGVLLAAYQLRRPTADIDLAARETSNETELVKDLMAEIASTVLPTELDDGLVFDAGTATVEAIRDGDEYSGVRVKLKAKLATAIESFHVDVNVGDPIAPEPVEIALPRLINAEPIGLRGYPLEMVLGRKDRHCAPARHRQHPLARFW